MSKRVQGFKRIYSFHSSTCRKSRKSVNSLINLMPKSIRETFGKELSNELPLKSKKSNSRCRA